jgi:predicted alpha/beta superfamily hydrolase
MHAIIHDSDSFLIDAAGASGQLRVDVALPPDFPQAGLGRSEAPLPLVIVLDADFSFPAAAAMSRLLMLGDTRPHIVAGIGYPDGESIARVTERRVFDFSPVGTELPLAAGMPTYETGGSDAFLKALAESIIPELAKRFAVDPEQVYLCGASMGGWFAGQALLHDIGRTFAGIAIFSGAFFYGERDILRQLKALTPDALAAGFRAFVSAGTREEEGPLAGGLMLTDASELIAAWRASGVPFEGHLLEGETHNMAFGPAYTRAMRYFLPLAPSGAESPLRFDGHTSAGQ